MYAPEDREECCENFFYTHELAGAHMNPQQLKLPTRYLYKIKIVRILAWKGKGLWNPLTPTPI